MIIAHLPAGYLAAKALEPQIGKTAAMGLIIGSVLPDADILWF